MPSHQSGGLHSPVRKPGLHEPRNHSSAGKESTCSAGDLGSVPRLGKAPGEGTGHHSSILAWRIPWTVWGCKELDTTERLSLSPSTLALTTSWERKPSFHSWFYIYIYKYIYIYIYTHTYTSVIWLHWAFIMAWGLFSCSMWDLVPWHHVEREYRGEPRPPTCEQSLLGASSLANSWMHPSVWP